MKFCIAFCGLLFYIKSKELSLLLGFILKHGNSLSQITEFVVQYAVLNGDKKFITGIRYRMCALGIERYRMLLS